ncbi:MAG: threonine/serine dehydratase [Gammaproteobacteria bacterium]|nr:threonine/serine dehydratase [Gammaproteobacteria bacterium]
MPLFPRGRANLPSSFTPGPAQGPTAPGDTELDDRMPAATTSMPDAVDVLATADLLRDRVVRTPLLRSPALDARVGGRILLKAESLQYTGSFKIRGAMSRLLRLDRSEAERGVVTFSSGNHGQAVAAAGRLLGIPVRVVMPDTAPAVKLERTRAQGAEVIRYDPALESRETIATELAERTGAVLVPSFDDRWVIAGQGTAGLEILEDLERLGLEADALLVCCGGGGLTAGCALALEAAHAGDIALHTVEPEGFDDHARSFVSGERERIAPGARSICDALLAPTPGVITFDINRTRVTSGPASSPTTRSGAPCALPSTICGWCSSPAAPWPWPHCWPAASRPVTGP